MNLNAYLSGIPSSLGLGHSRKHVIIMDLIYLCLLLYKKNQTIKVFKEKYIIILVFRNSKFFTLTYKV